MFWIIEMENGYLFDYDLEGKRIELTPLYYEARQFYTSEKARHVAKHLGGAVVEVPYERMKRNGDYFL